MEEPKYTLIKLPVGGIGVPPGSRGTELVKETFASFEDAVQAAKSDSQAILIIDEAGEALWSRETIQAR